MSFSNFMYLRPVLILTTKCTLCMQDPWRPADQADGAFMWKYLSIYHLASYLDNRRTNNHVHRNIFFLWTPRGLLKPVAFSECSITFGVHCFGPSLSLGRYAMLRRKGVVQGRNEFFLPGTGGNDTTVNSCHI